MEFQQVLAEKGYYTGPVNGVWGPECVEALKRFQQDQSLTPDGKLGALSIIALGLGPQRQAAAEVSAKADSAEQP
jgi:N-acetylmuramoyl-L-alanine amidase